MKYPFAITLAIFLLLIGVLPEDARAKILQMALRTLPNSRVSTSGRGRRRLASKGDILKASEKLSCLEGFRRIDFWRQRDVHSANKDLELRNACRQAVSVSLLGEKMRFGKKVPKITATFIRIGGWLWRWFLKREPNESNVLFCLEIAVEYLSKHCIVISVHWTSKCNARTSIRFSYLMVNFMSLRVLLSKHLCFALGVSFWVRILGLLWLSNWEY